MKYKVVSLFSGCGGLDLGFYEEGFETIVAIDNDPAAIKCFNQNFGHGGICMSVETEEFKSLIRNIGRTDIVLGGFPCQGFSKSGPKKKDDPRNQLYLSMLYAVEKLNPLIFVAENVDGLEQNFNGDILKKIIEDFSNIGYRVEYRIINAADFGVPQHRRRIFFIGHKTDTVFSWPEPTHYAKIRNGEFKSSKLLSADMPLFRKNALLPAVTVRESIEDLILLDNNIEDHVTIPNIKQKDNLITNHIGKGQKLCNVRFSDTSVYTWQIPEVFGEVTAKEKDILFTIAKNRRKKIYGNIPNGNPLSINTISVLSGFLLKEEELNKLEEAGYLKRVGDKFDLKGAMFCSGLYKRPLWDEPAPTVITLYHNPRNFLHPSENRPFTIRECARLQSFPDSFLFTKSKVSIQDSYRLIGNAVAPLVAERIAKSILSFLNQLAYSETQTFRQKQGELVS